ncbi:MAG: opacity family porin [Alphaproteobacteria bacterium]
MIGDVKSGSALAAAWGFRVSNHMRVEAEFSYRKQDISSKYRNPPQLQLPPFNLPPVQPLRTDGRMEDFGLGANVFYDFETTGRVQPFVGVGGGYEYVTLNDGQAHGHGDALRVQAIAGARFPITHTLLLSTDVRYTYLGNLGIDDGYSVQKIDLSSASANLGLVFDF